MSGRRVARRGALFRRRLQPGQVPAGERRLGGHAHDVVVGEQEEARLVEELAAGDVVDARVGDGDEPRAVRVQLVLQPLAGLGVDLAQDELVVARLDERLDPLGRNEQRPRGFAHRPYGNASAAVTSLMAGGFLFALVVLLLRAAPPAPPAGADLAARSQRAKELMGAGHYADAVPVYRELVKAVPDNPGLLANLGMALHLSGQDKEAIPPLEAALALAPDSLPAALFLGASQLRLGRAAAAVAPLQKVVRLQPDNVDARSLLGRRAAPAPPGPGRAEGPRGLVQPGQDLRGAGQPDLRRPPPARPRVRVHARPGRRRALRPGTEE